jgi:hypothetical protein
MTRNVLWLAAALAVSGCAGSRASQAKVADADYGRLSPGETGAVDEARQFRASANDELSRAKLRLQESRPELARADADRQAAEAEEKRAEVENQLANQSREPVQLERARRMQQQARLHRTAADAHHDYAKRLNEANEASVQAATDQVRLAEARLEWAKLQSLQQANVAASTKYDAGEFRSDVEDAQKAFDESLRRARELQGQAAASRSRWQDAQRQLQASGGAVQTG